MKPKDEIVLVGFKKNIDSINKISGIQIIESEQKFFNANRRPLVER